VAGIDAGCTQSRRRTADDSCTAHAACAGFQDGRRTTSWHARDVGPDEVEGRSVVQRVQQAVRHHAREPQAREPIPEAQCTWGSG
jgi:hypothetical protein